MFEKPEITSEQAQKIGRAAILTAAAVGGILGINAAAKKIALRRNARQMSHVTVLHDATVAEINEIVGDNVKCQYEWQEFPASAVTAMEGMTEQPVDNIGLHQPVIDALINHYRAVHPYALKNALIIHFGNDITVIVK